MNQAQLMKLLNRAEQYYKAKQHRLAKVDLEQIIKEFPTNSKANELIAYINSNEGNYDLAFRYLVIACKDTNCSAEALYYLASCYIKQNLIKEAVPLLEGSLNKAGDYFEALHDLGVAQTILGDKKSALNNLLKALPFRQNSFELLFNIAKTYDELKDYEMAFEFYSKVIEVNPSFAQAWSNRAIVLNEQSRYEEALINFDQAIKISPDFFEAIANKSITLNELKQFDNAIKNCDKAIQINVNYPLAYCIKGLALAELKQFDLAFDNINQAIDLNNKDPELLLSRALVQISSSEYHQALLDVDKALHLNPLNDNAICIKGLLDIHFAHYQDAHKHLDNALQINPVNPQAWFNKGNLLIATGQQEKSLEFFTKAKQLKPNIKYISGYIANAKLQVAHWDDLSLDIEEIIQKQLLGEPAATPFALFPIIDNPQLHLSAAKIWSQDHQLIQKSLAKIPDYTHPKIRIGYFSADFKNHPVSLLTAELFEKHDRSQFEVIAFAISKAPAGDEMRARLMKEFDQFIEVADQQEIQIAQLARDLEIDIAIDLGGHTLGAKPSIFYHRAAPIQVNYLGYAGSLGVDYMDYIIADEIVIPPNDQQYYSEKVVYLPHSFIPDDSQRQPSDRVFTRAELGLPEEGFIFCCFNNSYKFNAAMIDSWSRILLKVPQGVLWISKNNASFQANLLKEFGKRNITSDRIIFAERIDLMADHLARYRMADLFLDTLPYNAHTTALDALKTGVPLLTCIGQSFPARVAASLLTTLQMPDLITHTQEEYEKLAVTLANNSDQYQQIKDRLAQNLMTSPLFNSQLFTHHLEELYLNMYQTHLDDRVRS